MAAISADRALIADVNIFLPTAFLLNWLILSGSPRSPSSGVTKLKAPKYLSLKSILLESYFPVYAAQSTAIPALIELNNSYINIHGYLIDYTE